MYMFNRKLIITACTFLCAGMLSAQSVDVKVGDESIKITPVGRMYLDGAVFMEDETSLDNGVTMSDLRLGLKAKYKSWEVKLDIGYANSKVSAKDIFVQYNLNKSSYVRGGNFIEPFGLDHMESSSNTTFISPNGSSNVFAPSRKIGLEYIGWSKLFWYGGGVFADNGAIKNEQDRGDDGYSGAGRFVFTPFEESGKILHIGLAGALRKADASGKDEEGSAKYLRKFKFASNILNTKDTRTAIGTTINNADFQAKYAVELIAAYGPLYLQGEYFHSNTKRRAGLPTYKADGAYAQIGFLAIGGNYGYSSSWSRMATPRPGSLEFAVRYNYTNLDGNEFSKGGTMSDITLGANYFLNKYMAIKLNYSYMSLGQNAALANENISVFSVRYQVVF